MSSEENKSPPEGPDVERRVRLLKFQWIGIPILLLLPIVLAATGLLGERWATRTATAGPLDVSVQWPTSIRYKQLNDIQIHVRNRSAVTLDTIDIEVDTSYASRFSTVQAIPSFERAYALALTDVRSGSSALGIIELQAERYGRHTGMVTISAGRDTIRIPLHTTIFP